MGQFSVLEKKVNKMLEFEELLHDVPKGKVEKNEIVGNSAIDEKEKATCADKTTVTEMSDDSVIVITSTPPEFYLNTIAEANNNSSGIPIAEANNNTSEIPDAMSSGNGIEIDAKCGESKEVELCGKNSTVGLCDSMQMSVDGTGDNGRESFLMAQQMDKSMASKNPAQSLDPSFVSNLLLAYNEAEAIAKMTDNHKPKKQKKSKKDKKHKKERKMSA